MSELLSDKWGWGEEGQMVAAEQHMVQDESSTINEYQEMVELLLKDSITEGATVDSDGMQALV